MYERIRNLREDHDLKQEDIARLLHCTQACYSNYEFKNGRILSFCDVEKHVDTQRFFVFVV